MKVIWLLLPLILTITAGFVVAFIVAAGRGQFDDLETPEARLVLWDKTEFDLGERNRRDG